MREYETDNLEEEIREETSADVAAETPEIRRQRRTKRRMANEWRVAVSVCFLLLLVALLVFSLLAKDRKFSRVENRNLAGRPELSVDAIKEGRFATETDSYFSDQFFGRDGWIGLNYFVHRVLGQRESGGVYAGRDGRLYMEPVEPNAEALKGSAEAVNTFAATHPDIACRMMLVPGAAAVYEDRLPKGAPVRDQRQDMQDFLSMLDSKVRIIDALSVLETQKSEEIYYRTDHHWTSLGAYRVFQATAAEMGIDPIGDYEAMLVANNFHGTLSSKSGSTSGNDDIYIYEPMGENTTAYVVNYPETKTKTATIFEVDRLLDKDQYTVFFGGNHPVVEIDTAVSNGRRLIVFKDSYANCFVQFLIPHYERIVMVDPRYCYEKADDLINQYEINEALFLYSADILFRDTDLADMF